ncbi:MAG: hypothetical protein H7293_00155 [Candidatus Saccharibacteria bacterium]|nr:hypothetical protein [Rhodoferax sp.]
MVEQDALSDAASVLMPMRTMQMLMGNLFFAGLAHVEHLRGKAQRLACHPMVAVQQHGVNVNFMMLNGDIAC